MTVVVVDPSGTVDEADHAAIAAALPDAVSVAVLRARAPGPETSDG